MKLKAIPLNSEARVRLIMDEVLEVLDAMNLRAVSHHTVKNEDVTVRMTLKLTQTHTALDRIETQVNRDGYVVGACSRVGDPPGVYIRTREFVISAVEGSREHGAGCAPDCECRTPFSEMNGRQKSLAIQNLERRVCELEKTLLKSGRRQTRGSFRLKDPLP